MLNTIGGGWGEFTGEDREKWKRGEPEKGGGSKNFPPEEKYSLTDQIRRSSRSLCANLGEPWRKRRYKAAYIAKLSGSETETCETQVWLETAFLSGYISKNQFEKLDRDSRKYNRSIDNND